MRESSGGSSTSVTGMNQPLAARSISPPTAKRWPSLRQSSKKPITFSYCGRFWIGPSTVSGSLPSPTFCALMNSTSAASTAS